MTNASTATPAVEPGGDVTDTMLWRRAHDVLAVHQPSRDGTCGFCGVPAPCHPRLLALHADRMSRVPDGQWRGAHTGHADLTSTSAHPASRFYEALGARRRPSPRRTPNAENGSAACA